MLGCAGEVDIICCLLLPLLLLLIIEGSTPDTFTGGVAPPLSSRADTMWDRSAANPAANLCLVFSTCSHSFISNVSISANCFSFNSNLFNCQLIRANQIIQVSHTKILALRLFSIYQLLQEGSLTCLYVHACAF